MVFRVVCSVKNFVKNSVKLRAESTPKTASCSDLTPRKQKHSRRYTCPVNRRVVGSSPTSGANQINQLGRTLTEAFSDTGENTGDSLSKGVLLMLSTAPRNSFNVKWP